jgi:hypothetical protein
MLNLIKSVSDEVLRYGGARLTTTTMIIIEMPVDMVPAIRSAP